MRRPAAIALLALLVVVPLLVQAAPLTGRPAIQRFTPDLDVYPAAFAVAQDEAGIVYVGAADGLLSFDGAHWYEHPMPNDDLVRSMALDGKGRLYLGGYGAFGFVETPIAPDGEVTLLSHSVDEADAEFADVWQILVAPEGVFFLALNHLFLHDPASGSLRTFRHDGRFGAIARVDERVVVQYRGEGLREFDGESFVPIPGTDGLDEQLFYLVPLETGGAISLARDGRWRHFGADGVNDYPVPPELPPSSEFNGAVRTPDGRIALGARDGQVWFLDPQAGDDHRRVESVRVTTDWIAGLASSREGGLIVQTDHETLHLRWPSEWTALGPDDGLTGSPFEFIEWQGRWYVISNSGVLARPTPDDPFELLDWTDFEAWDLEPLGDGTALLSESYVLKHVSPDGLIEAFEAIQYPRRVVTSRFDPGVYYVGTEFGVAVLRRDETGAWEVLKGSDETADGSFTLIEIGPGDLLVGTELQGVLRLQFDPDRRTVTSRTTFDGTLDYGDWQAGEVLRIGGEIHAVTMSGVWVWRNGAFVDAELRGLDALRSDDGFLTLTEGPDGVLWAWDYDRLYRQGPGDSWLEMEIAPLLRGAIASVSFAPDGRLLAGMLGGVLIHDPDARQTSHPGMQPLLRSVVYRELGGADAGPARRLAIDRAHSLQPDGRFSMRFEYALPGLDGRDDVAYQARMRGFEDAFSEWGPVDHFTYFDLQPGRFSFEVRARDALGRVTRIEPFEFEIVPPWYRSDWALLARWVLFGLVLMLLVWLAMRARLWRLENERRRLATMVEQRTEALEAANRQLKLISETDELTGAANRRRLDVVLRRRLTECRRRHRPMALALIDLDRFKPFNDDHGHLAGDRALRQVAETLRGVFNEEDQLVARFGGDEFVVLLPGVDRSRALALAQDARAALDECGFDLKFSIGIAIAGIGTDVEPDALIEAADRQMYVAKKSGRDGVSVRTIEGAEG